MADIQVGDDWAVSERESDAGQCKVRERRRKSFVGQAMSRAEYVKPFIPLVALL